jgi:hypothetical protein
MGFNSAFKGLRDNVEKYCIAGQATDGNMAHAHCMLDILSYKYTIRKCNGYCLFPLQQW